MDPERTPLATAPPQFPTHGRLLIEGWRGVNHSFALVNQCQILELLKLPGLQLFHRDLPLAMPHWSPATHGPGFPAEDLSRIAALRAPQGVAVDCIYRITSPFRSGEDCVEAHGDAVPTISFMVTEMGLTPRSFEPGAGHSDRFTRNANLIVTPTRWSRERLLEWGYAPDKVHVVTHGVNSATFYPLDPETRASNRRNLGHDDGHCVFVNLGAAMWNKGMDVLLLAHATLRQKHKHVRLVLKDQRSLYGVGIEGTIARLCQEHPGLFTADTLASISTVGTNLSQQQLRLLYGIADGYVSTYRAEGFNLPVLEAIACGTPALVTAGGATDDFCHPGVAVRIDSRPGTLNDAEHERAARYREPDLDATVHAMADLALGRGLVRSAAMDTAGRALARNLSWNRAVSELLALTPLNRRPEPSLAKVSGWPEAARLPSETCCSKS